MIFRSTGATRRTRLTTFAALGATAALALSGCAGGASDAAAGGDSAEVTPVKFQTSWIPLVQFGGSYIADSEGYYEEEGVDVEILPGGPEVDPLALLEAGEVDIAVSNADNVARANAEGADLIIIGAGFQRNPLAVLSDSEDPIESPDDLAGTSIGVPAGDTAAHEALVDLNGLDGSAVEVVPVGFDVAPLVSGEVDGLYVFYTEQPIAYEAEGRTGVTFLLADHGFDVFAQVYTVRRDTLEENPDMVESFMRGEIRGWQDYVEDPATAVDLTVNEYAADAGLDADVQTEQASRQMELLVTEDTEEHGLFWMTEDAIAANVEVIDGLGIEGVDEGLFDISVLEGIYDGESSL